MQTTAILMILALVAPLQRIETQYPDRGKVIRLETAMDHLTVIELAEPVTLAAAGSSLFKIERRDNKVFIQPLEEGASTNLFVWTGSGRWTYELVPAASVATTHFAIDQQPTAALDSPPQAAPNAATQDGVATQSFAEEMLLFAKPVRNIASKSRSSEVRALVTDVFRKDDQLFIRYAIDNRTTHAYQSGVPEVFALESAYARVSLHTYRYSQVSPDMAKEIRSRGESRVQTIDCELPSEPIPSGEVATGILTLHLPANTSEPQVLRLVFPASGSKPISVVVVL
jgi:hypothetical protein